VVSAATKAKIPKQATLLFILLLTDGHSWWHAQGYSGSINLTRSSETHKECVVKVKGPQVKELLQAVMDIIKEL